MPNSDDTLQQLILSEVRGFRDDIKEFRSDIQALRGDFQEHALSMTSRVTAVEVSLKPLLPNGRPGLIADMKADIAKIKERLKYIAGAAVGAGAVVSFAMHFLVR